MAHGISPLNGERAGVRGEAVPTRNRGSKVKVGLTPHPHSLSPWRGEGGPRATRQTLAPRRARRQSCKKVGCARFDFLSTDGLASLCPTGSQCFAMSKLRLLCFGVSIDGFGAGPDQSLDHSLGVGGLGRGGIETEHLI